MSFGGIIDSKKCPLRKFEILGGSYTSDPVECCFECNFADLSAKEFDLDNICKCPVAKMDSEEYKSLKEDFLTYLQMNLYRAHTHNTREDFWEFAKKKYS